MKRYIYACWLLLLSFPALAQSVEGRVEYQKNKYRAAVLEVPYPPQQVEEAFDQYLKKQGAPGSPVRGFRLYRNVKLNGQRNFYGDLYVNTEKKSRREKEATTISVVVGRPNETITNRSPDDDYGLAEAKDFLNRMVAEVSAHSLDQAILAQEEALKKSNRKYDDLMADSSELVRRQTELNEKIGKNGESLKAQRASIAKEKEMLEGMKNKKKEGSN